MPALLGRKIGMTRLNVTRRRKFQKEMLAEYEHSLDASAFEPDENSEFETTNEPVTVIEVGPCFVSQIKSTETDGYNAVQIAFDDVKGRNTTRPLIGHDGKAGLTPKRVHREFPVSEEELAGYELGQEIKVDAFESTLFVDVTGTSKGKGTAGVMKRYRFKGQPASHGTERKHRSPGSISGRASNLGTGKSKKGIRMGGRMGNERVSVRSLDLFGIDKEKNLLLVKGPVPGPNGGLLMSREATRLYSRKARRKAVSQQAS